MKTVKSILTLLGTAMFFISCQTSYYQIYSTKPADNIIKVDNVLVYEDANCKISYDLWQNGGDIGFKFYNKTDKNIYINLPESFYVLNGNAYNYYKNRIFTDSKSSNISSTKSLNLGKSVLGLSNSNLPVVSSFSLFSATTNSTTSGYSVAYVEDKNVCIPPKSSKSFSEYTINENLFSDCDLNQYPSKKNIKTKHFDKSNSPLVFSNRIAYTIDQNTNNIIVTNDFYVSDITNLPESEMLIKVYENECGKKSSYPFTVVKKEDPNKFFIRYTGLN